MAVTDSAGLKAHTGHELECVVYGMDRNVAVECLDCNEVLLDADNPAYLSNRTDIEYREHCNVVYSVLREHIGHKIVIEQNDAGNFRALMCRDCGCWIHNG